MEKTHPELDDELMLQLLEEAKQLYEDGAIIEAGAKARSFAMKIAWFAKKYAEAEHA